MVSTYTSPGHTSSVLDQPYPLFFMVCIPEGPYPFEESYSCMDKSCLVFN